MVISDQYGMIATPSEANSDFSGVVTALGAPFAIPTNLPASAVHIAAAAFMAQNGSLPGGPGGTFSTAQNMTRNLPQ